MVGSIRSRFARLSVFSAIALGLLQVPPVLAAESLCKHNSPTSNIECKPRDSKPWV